MSMAVDLIWRDLETKWEITRSEEPSNATINLLKSTIWGSRSTKYRILDLERKLARLRNPSFFVLSEDGRELCVFVLDKCVKRVSGADCGAYHFVMASTVADRQNQGLAGRLIEHVREFCIATVGRPGLGFAYVEETTEFSLRLSEQIGHSMDADIPLTIFTRVFPRSQPKVGRMQQSEAAAVQAQLEQMYQDHQLSDFATSFNPEDCLVYREKGAILVAAQIELLHWSMVSMPGTLGAFLLNVLPHVPGLRRILDLKNLNIIRFSNLFFADASEKELFQLLESSLHYHGSNVGLIMLDARSPVLRRITEYGGMGLLSRSVNGSAKLRIDVIGMNEAMIADLSEKPLLVSAADVF